MVLIADPRYIVVGEHDIELLVQIMNSQWTLNKSFLRWAISVPCEFFDENILQDIGSAPVTYM